MEKMTVAEMWDYLVDNEIATEAELSLVTCINGYNEKAMLGVLYARTGYNDFDQLNDDEEEEGEGEE